MNINFNCKPLTWPTAVATYEDIVAFAGVSSTQAPTVLVMRSGKIVAELLPTGKVDLLPGDSISVDLTTC